MLLHQHDQAMEDEEDGMSPGPISQQGETNDTADEGGLP
jgi:hypothetical protein